jgi:hypothetical protein
VSVRTALNANCVQRWSASYDQQSLLALASALLEDQHRQPTPP